MRALLYPEFGRLCVADVPLPTPEADSAIVHVAACGICGSEIESFKTRSSRRPPPLVMGHEFCGTVVKIGPAVRNFNIGDKVIAHSVVHCGVCPSCLQGRTHLCSARQIFGMNRAGAFAEYVSAPERCLIRWPEGLSAEEASFTEPLANGVHVSNLTQHLPVESVLVIGAGPIGLMSQLAISALRQARVFTTDINRARLDTARMLGAVVRVDLTPDGVLSWIKSETGGQGADLVIDAVGSAATRRQSIACARSGGAVVWIGLHEDAATLSSYEVILREKQVLGTYAATMGELNAAAQLLASRRVNIGSLAKSYPLEKGVTAFKQACLGKNIKSVLLPQ